MDMDLFLLNKLSQLKDGNSGGSGGPSGGYLISPHDSSKTNFSTNRQPFYSVYSTNARYAYDNGEWSSSSQSGNFSTSAQYGHQDQRQIFFAASENLDRQSNNKFFNATMENRGYTNSSGRIYHSLYKNCGINQLTHVIRYHDNYPSFGSNIVFLKNPTESTISTTLYFQFSCRYSHSYDGACLIEYTPNNTVYSQVTSVNKNTMWTYTSNTWWTTSSVSINIGAGQTRAYVLCNGFYYYTGTDNGYWVYEGNNWYNTHVPINAGLVIDNKATQHYLCNRVANYNGNDGNDSDLVTFWKSLGETFGDNT